MKKLLLTLFFFFIFVNYSHAVLITLQDPDTENLEDAWVKENTPNVPNGDDTVLHVRSVAAANEWTFIKFTMSQTPQNVAIDDALLCLYLSSTSSNDRNISVFNVPSTSWTESITWNTKPAVGGVVNTTFANIGSNHWMYFDVTEDIQSVHSKGNASASYMLRDDIQDDEGTSWFNSKEIGGGGIVTRPYLNVTYHVISGPYVTTINKPTNTTYGAFNTTLDVTVTDVTGLDSCKYELNGANHTLPNCADATFLAVEGLNNIVLWANNTAGFWNASARRYFTVNTVGPTISILAPANTTYAKINVSLNYSVTDQNDVDTCKYELNGNANVTLPSCDNATFIADSGWNVLRLYANDSLGNWNFSIANFTVDIQPVINNIEINFSDVGGDFNISIRINVTDLDGSVDIDRCWVDDLWSKVVNDFCILDIHEGFVNWSTIWVNDSYNNNDSITFNFTYINATYVNDSATFCPNLSLQRITKTDYLFNNDTTYGFNYSVSLHIGYPGNLTKLTWVVGGPWNGETDANGGLLDYGAFYSVLQSDWINETRVIYNITDADIEMGNYSRAYMTFQLNSTFDGEFRNISVNITSLIPIGWVINNSGGEFFKLNLTSSSDSRTNVTIKSIVVANLSLSAGECDGFTTYSTYCIRANMTATNIYYTVRHKINVSDDVAKQFPMYFEFLASTFSGWAARTAGTELAFTNISSTNTSVFDNTTHINVQIGISHSTSSLGFGMYLLDVNYTYAIPAPPGGGGGPGGGTTIIYGNATQFMLQADVLNITVPIGVPTSFYITVSNIGGSNGYFYPNCSGEICPYINFILKRVFINVNKTENVRYDIFLPSNFTEGKYNFMITGNDAIVGLRYIMTAEKIPYLEWLYKETELPYIGTILVWQWLIILLMLMGFTYWILGSTKNKFWLSLAVYGIGIFVVVFML